ncbi:MAG: hypothetical protein AB8B50_07640 [Pirellulaceae bacterium]
MSFALIRLKGQCPPTAKAIGLLAFCLISITCFTLRFGDPEWYEFAGLLAASFLIYAVLFPATQFREHGIHQGLNFIPWHNISRFEWEERGERFVSLALQGPWLGKRRVIVHRDQQDLANGIISGAARLEPTPQWRVRLSLALRCALFIATATAAWFFG